MPGPIICLGRRVFPTDWARFSGTTAGAWNGSGNGRILAAGGRSPREGPFFHLLEFARRLPIVRPVQFIRDIHAAKKAAGQTVISFEFFPPKTDEGDRNLLEKTIPALMQLRPDYCSVTYGAGGSTRDKTLMIVDRIQRQHGLTAMAHLTCVNSTQEQLREIGRASCTERV